ncbi:MAG: hypothetical protein HY775_02715 [Acidobacteria bacterium]|nr:hypothetical protein [Acidobacteriota bacterium]
MRLERLLRWSNRPHRRADCVWVADMRGFIETSDGARILVEMGGRSLPEEAPGGCATSCAGSRRRPTTSMTLRAWACVSELPPGDGPGES